MNFGQLYGKMHRSVITSVARIPAIIQKQCGEIGDCNAKIVTALIAISMVLHPSIVYAEFPTEKPPKPPDPARLAFDDACAMLAAAILAGYRDEKEQQWLSTCSTHPDKGICEATKKFMEEQRRPVPGLICGRTRARPAR